MIDPKKLPPAMRRQWRWVAAIVAMLLAVVFLLGFTVCPLFARPWLTPLGS